MGCPSNQTIKRCLSNTKVDTLAHQRASCQAFQQVSAHLAGCRCRSSYQGALQRNILIFNSSEQYDSSEPVEPFAVGQSRQVAVLHFVGVLQEQLFYAVAALRFHQKPDTQAQNSAALEVSEVRRRQTDIPFQSMCPQTQMRQGSSDDKPS